MASTIDDRGLVEQVRAGQVEAFNVLVDRHQSAAYNLALRMLGNADAAADVTQDALLSAYRHLDSFRGIAFRPWLLRIVTNACYDELRRRQRRPSESLDELLDDEERAFEPVADEAGPEILAEQHDIQRRLGALLLRLPPEFRAVLILSDVQGFSYDEIVEILGIELGTVKSRLSRARARMRDLLRADRELYDETHRLIRKKDGGQ